MSLTGFASYTKTFIGKEGEQPSPHLKKLKRYTSIVGPGDVVVNPPWFWHGVLNLGNVSSKDELVIGVPTRYSGLASLKAGMRTNFVFTINALVTLVRRHGFVALSPTFKLNVQNGIQMNVQQRKRTESREEMHPMDLDE